jgi:CBS domain containing-hemolysin-like protein
MKKNEYLDLWKQGFFLALKIYALAYIVQILFMFTLGILLGIIGPLLPQYVGLGIVIILALILAPPLIAIGAEHLKITKEPKNKLGIDFTK